MKVLKAKTSHPKKQIFPINDLNYNLYYTHNNSKLVNGAEDILEGADMIDPIQVKKYTKSKTPRYGANGKVYRERVYGVWKGNQRVTAAVKLGYTHIEGILIND
tara:strand:- start:1013 stop:1324 length:312 start_codon:yes stop_codon:yes gene_type:complete